jgi:hypothetical protein
VTIYSEVQRIGDCLRRRCFHFACFQAKHRTVPHGSTPYPLGHSITRRSRRLVVASAIMAVLTISVPARSGAFPSKGKIIGPKKSVAPKRSYQLSVDGSFSLTEGQAVESGTLTAPNIILDRVSAGKKKYTWFGKGTGRVTDLLIVEEGCRLDGDIIFGMFGTGPLPFVPEPTVPNEESLDENGEDSRDELAPLVPKIPVGFVGVTVGGAAVSGMKSKQCNLKVLGPQTVNMTGGAAIAALAVANQGALIFPNAGGMIVRTSAGNPSYRFTYILR